VRFLLIRLSSLGDIILTTPLVCELRKKYPDARIDFLVRKEYSDIVRQFPWLTNIIELDTTKGNEEIRRVASVLKKKHYHHILDLHNNLRSRMLRKKLGGKLHVVNKRIVQRWILVKYKINLLQKAPDIIGRYFETVSDLGVIDLGTGATFGKEYQRSEILKAAICPGAKHWNKRWIPEYVVEVAKDIIANGYRIEFYGSKDEKEYINAISSQLPQDKVTNLAGEISLLDLPEKMAECSLAITNDSGLMHVASAVGIRTISIAGPTVKEFGFYPRTKNAIVIENNDLDCRPCTTIGLENCPKGHFKCMKEITPLTIIEAIPRV
jgi:heptosyltransferase-2